MEKFVDYIAERPRTTPSPWRNLNYLRGILKEGIFHAERALDDWINMPWDIGISTMFQQNMGALSIARRLKNQFNLHIIFCGANYQGIMGKKLIEPYSYIDVVCTVESEEAFLFYVEQYML